MGYAIGDMSDCILVFIDQGLELMPAWQRLNEFNADVLFVGDSHTYSWTYPLQGFDDENLNGVIEANEVQIDTTDRFCFQQGDGLVQVVAGVGGYSLRSHAYPDPFIASAYSTSDQTGPIEYGFAQIDITDQSLTVSYISAESGLVVGDTNGNGHHDADEPYFGQFTIERTVSAAQSQYSVSQPPRLQLGDAPLVGTPAYDGWDRVDVLWQTMKVGEGAADSFEVEYRLTESDTWLAGELHEPFATNATSRTMPQGGAAAT